MVLTADPVQVVHVVVVVDVVASTCILSMPLLWLLHAAAVVIVVVFVFTCVV